MAYDAQPVGFLATVISKIYKYSGESSTEAKWPPEDLYDMIQTAFSEIMDDVNGMGQNPIIVRHSITVVEGQQAYLLPPNIGKILKIGFLRTESGVVSDSIRPRSFLSPIHSGVRFAGNTIVFEPIRQYTEPVIVEYIPDGFCTLHLGSVNFSDPSSTPSGFILDQNPAEGYFDRRPNAPLGSMVRVLGSDESDDVPPYTYFPIQERIVSACDPETGEITVTPDFDFTEEMMAGLGWCTYEIVPFANYIFGQLMDAIAWKVCYSLSVAEPQSERTRSFLHRYSVCMRSIRMRVSALNGRNGFTWATDTPGTNAYHQNAIFAYDY